MKREPLTVIQVQRRDTIDGRAHNPGLLGWRSLAYCPAADAPAELERQRARFGHHEPTLEFRSRTANGAQPHAHVPPQTVALGFALDLTTQFRDVRTTWDFEVKGWRMLCEPGAMDQPPGRAALYLVRVDVEEDTRRNPSHALEKAIGVWQESEGVWIVSLDELDDDGNAETTRTLSVHDTRAEAMRTAKKEAAKRKLQIIEGKDTRRNPSHANSEREQNAGKRKSRELSRDRASMQTLWIGHHEAGVVGRALWVDLDGAERERWIAVTYDGAELQAHPEDTHAAPFEQTFATQNDARHALSDYFRASPPRQTNGRRNPSHAEGRRTYERWHEREAAHVTTVDDLPDLIGIYVGRAMRIGYSSDKWHARGKTIDYEHDFSERGHIAPECWADTADLADARALAIVGGSMRITEDGID